MTTKLRRTLIVCALLLIVCLISTAMLSGTFAKYTSEYAGQDTALVARWSFTSDSITSGTHDNPMELAIWEHVYATNIYQKTAGGDYLIAPGIQGSFTVDFSYDADVDADLTLNFTKSGDGSTLVPLQYSLDQNFTEIYYSLDALENALITTATTDSTSKITGGNGTYVVTNTATAREGKVNPSPISIEQTVYWRWPYDVSQHDNAKLLATPAEEIIRPQNNDSWTDADDVRAGNSSHGKGLTRDSYVLQLDVKAVQKEPAKE
ncbi:MAG: hypothetical protein ACOYIB_00110 [Desulfosporosinus sp.]|jgi:hypothetical protein